MKKLTDFCKTVETGVDPRLLLSSSFFTQAKVYIFHDVISIAIFSYQYNVKRLYIFFFRHRKTASLPPTTQCYR